MYTGRAIATPRSLTPPFSMRGAGLFQLYNAQYPEFEVLRQAKIKKKELTESLLGGTMKPAMFASALLCMSREKQTKVLQKLVADAALKGNLRRTYIAHLEAMASVLSPSGMALAAHAYKVSSALL